MVYIRGRSLQIYHRWLCMTLWIRRLQRAVMFYVCCKRFRILSCLLFLFLLYGLLWYIGRFHFGSEFVKTDRLYVCLEDRVKSFSKKVSEFDAFILRSNIPNLGIFPFVGNGYIGCSFQENKLLLRHLGHLSQSLDIPVLISLDVHGYISDSLVVLDIHDGIVYKMHCFKHENELCVSSGTMVYAHRLYTNLIIQNFRVYNPLDTAAVVKVNKDSIPNKKLILRRRTLRLKQKNLPGVETPRDVKYEVIYGLITLHDEELTDEDWKVPSDPQQSRRTAAHVLVFVLFEPVFPDNLSVGAGETQSYSFITGARVSDAPMPVSNSDLASANMHGSRIDQECARLESMVRTELIFALQYPESELRILHTAAWNRLWLSGVTLSYSFAPNVLNGKHINTTLYYLLANTPDILQEQTEKNQTDFEQYRFLSLTRYNCSTGPDLFHSKSHWVPVSSSDKMRWLVRHWRSSLTKTNCRGLWDGGAHRRLQAALLSLGAFQLHSEYTSIGLLPSQLDRDLLFRRVELHEPGVYINFQIRIVPGELSLSSPHLMVVELSVWRPKIPLSLSAMARARPPRPALMLSQPLEGQLPVAEPDPTLSDMDAPMLIEHEAQDVPLFVCPAGCLSKPTTVGKSKTLVPFLATTPPTALLYFGTRDDTTLSKYGRLRQYSDIHPGPHPDHDVITLHRHGHAFGGLPWLFWISLGLLITLFHLFFCKIIYNELWRDNAKTTDQENWSLPRYAADLGAPDSIRMRAAIKAQLLSKRRTMHELDSFP